MGNKKGKNENCSDIMIEVELVRVGPEAYRVYLFRPFVLYPGADDILGEYAAGEQIFVVALERRNRRLQASGEFPDLVGLFLRHVVDVL